MSEKLCVFCNHINFGQTQMYESGGGDSTVECERGYFGYSRILSIDDFRTLILQAQTCPDYDQVKP